MKVGEIDIKWDMGYEVAADILQAIQTVCSSDGLVAVEGRDFKVIKASSGSGIITLMIDKEFYQV